MTDDLLKRAASALREETGEPELRSGLTRARVLDDAAKQQRTRGNPLRWLVPFVITLGAGTALAHVTHQYFPEVWNAVVPAALERPVPEEEVRLAKKPKRRTAPVPVPAPEPAPIATPEPIAPPEPEVVEPAAHDKPARAKRTPAPRATEPSAPEPPVLVVKPAAEPEPEPKPQAESAELALFRRALALHDQRDARAIRAWDDFLRVAPKSPLATEARYNRALGLVRAGRSSEAKAALAPFARGDFGNYRKREARELLEALEARDGGAPAR